VIGRQIFLFPYAPPSGSASVMAKIVIILANFRHSPIFTLKETVMATMNVSLPEQMKAWVERQAEGGLYGNASDYIRDLIRKDQERREAVAALQAAINEGLASGEPQAFDSAAFKLRMRERHVIR
jgi:antitoxin ParD1/3/4